MLGERIKHYRMLKGWKQDELAEKLFVSAGYVSALKRGHKTPSLPCVLKLIELLGCSPNELLEYNGLGISEGLNAANLDNTISSTVKLMLLLNPEGKYKVFNYAKDQSSIPSMTTPH